jgi:hypothetical protein
MTTRPNLSPWSKRRISPFTAVTFKATLRASLGGVIIASMVPDILGWALGEPGGAQGCGRVSFMFDRWIEERRSEVFVARSGTEIGRVIEDRIPGSHFGAEGDGEPEMKTVMF